MIVIFLLQEQKHEHGIKNKNKLKKNYIKFAKVKVFLAIFFTVETSTEITNHLISHKTMGRKQKQGCVIKTNSATTTKATTTTKKVTIIVYNDDGGGGIN